MTSKRRSSPGTKKPSNARPKGSQSSAFLSSTDQSDADEEEDLEESEQVSGETRELLGYSADWTRWKNLSQHLGSQDLTQPEVLNQVLTWAEAQAAAEEVDLDEASSQSTLLKKTLGLASQLLITLNSLAAQLQQQQQQQQQQNEALVKILQTVTSAPTLKMASVSSARRGAANLQGSFSEFESKELKKSHAKGSAEEKLRRALQAIIAYNETPERNPAEKWAINQNALAELTGCNRPAIKQFLKQYGDEIEAHHQKHNLLPRHNYSHGKNGVKITDIIRW